MTYLEERNQKIIDAVIKKANRVCPGALALVGINGSFMTGDFYEKSDLDLLILVGDDRGRQLACTFIQDDLFVGHDLYGYTWERLEADAKYEHPYISKLMDSKIVYCSDAKYMERLNDLRKRAWNILDAPFSMEDYEKAEKTLKEAEHCFAMTMASDGMPQVRDFAGGVIYYVENAIAMLNKQYFRYGVKRAYRELDGMKHRPEGLSDMIEAIVSAMTEEEIKANVAALIKETIAVFRRVKESIPVERKPVTEDSIGGTYEEFVSNWRNKMHLAAATENRHLAFMSLVSANAMFADIAGEVEIGKYDTLSEYDPQDLQKTAKSYDDLLAEYRKAYEKAGVQVKHYPDIDAFVREYERVNSVKK